MTSKNDNPKQLKSASTDKDDKSKKEVGGPKGKEPTRYGDWEKNGKCVDF